MTECERLIKENKLDPEFLSEEIRCDYTISVEMKKIWAIEIDLLSELLNVCDKYDLKCFASGGTLLGAVRHKGYIPWDDDIDVIMPRDDYEKLIEIGEKEFKEPYFFQTPYNDPGYIYSHVRLRNSNTTAFTYPFRYCTYNQGIWIDILPLDNSIFEKEAYRREKIFNTIMSGSALMRVPSKEKSEDDIKKIEKYYKEDLSTIEIFEKIKKYATMFNDEITDYVGCPSQTVYSFEKAYWKRELFEKVIKLKFEYIEVYAPENYDEVLKVTFGDYMKFPPRDTWGKWHNSLCDPDVPYKEYGKKELGLLY